MKLLNNNKINIKEVNIATETTNIVSINYYIHNNVFVSTTSVTTYIVTYSVHFNRPIFLDLRIR